MTEPLLLLLLVAVVAVPALLLARSRRRLGGAVRRTERLEIWASPRGWRVLGAAPEVLGRWRCPPFTAPEREVDDAVAGPYRGREATSFRLETAPPREVTHVLTVELRVDAPVAQMMTDGVPVDELGAAGGAWLSERAPTGLSLRVERGALVGWLPGEPLLTELDRYLDVLVDVAETLERLR
ncbi:hypothetical protein [Georgenia satyanarayanai]|uniref:hypothetical protein n=1 Tax=Georgenia satyanarayanai TaxID=860221 RepID=UPI0012654FEA|nr:hypothetical protein [Georgenia satyanarayanai]